MEQEIAKFFWSYNETFIFDVFQIVSGKIYIFITSSVFIVYALFRFKKRGIIILLAALLAVALSDIICYRVLKPVFKRPRPVVELNLKANEIAEKNKLINAKDYSMPSNHASNIFAFFIIYLFYVKRFWPLLFINSVLISASRIILVKHYPSDVFAGIVVGIFLGLILIFTLSLCKFKPLLTEKI